MIEYSMANIFLNCYMEAENNTPDHEGESCCEKMASLKPRSAHSREGGDLFAGPADGRKDMGNFWASFLLVAFWGAREVLGHIGEGGSRQECLNPPKVRTLLTKTCLIQH